MPSFLGRLFGVSFRTERLIMTFIGLVNSTLDWHPLKWTNKLEQIWNLSLSQKTLILDTIGEERIKAVLAYIVIVRILIAHVFTLSCVLNFYPIITWSRPNWLIPWLFLSFFKNFVLEVIVIAVGLLFWYDKRFSLPIFLEFVLVKVVPLLFATYNWYSNSRLYLKLRYIEKTRRLTRNMRSDSNLIATRLYLKIAESKYRARSVTTLISWESYDTHDTSDTISRIIENPHLSPAQKAKRILGLNEQEIDEARVRIREREIRRRLTEEEDEEFLNSPRDLSRYLSMVSHYDFGKKSSMLVRNESRRSELEKKAEESYEDSRNSGANDEVKLNISVKSETGRGNFLLDNPLSSPTSNPSLGNPRDLPKNSPTPNAKDATEVLENPEANPVGPITDNSPNTSQTNSRSNLTSVTGDPTMKKEEIKSLNESETNRTHYSPSRVIDAKNNSSSSKNQDPTGLSCVQKIIQNAEETCPVKAQQPFSCNCSPDGYRFKGKMEICCLSRNVAMRTSTPNSSPGRGRKVENFKDSECSKDPIYHTCDNDFMVVNEMFDSRRNDDSPLMEELLKKDLDVLRSMGKIDGGLDGDMNEYRCDKEVLVVEKNETVAVSKLYNGQGAIGVRNLPKILKNLCVKADTVDSLEAIDTTKARKGVTKTEDESEIRQSAKGSMNCAVNNGANSVQKSSLNPYIQGIDRDLLNTNLPEYSFGDTNTPMFYKDSMKVFDGCYEKDFANNSELQCLLQQLEKKKWSLFPGQTNREILLPNNLLMQNDQLTMQNLRAAYHLTSDFENMNRHETSVSSSPKTDREQVISSIVQMNSNSKENPTRLKNNEPNQNTPNRTKDASTQLTDDFPTRRATCILKDARKRRKSVKRKCLKNETANASPTNSNRYPNTELHNSFWRNNSKLSVRQKLPKTLDAQKRPPPHLAKSVSDKSVCECRMPQTGNKHSASSITKADRRNESRKSTTKCKVDNFATLTLPQVAKPSTLDTVYRRKPPVYPKATKNEVPSQTNSSAASSKGSSNIGRLLDIPKKIIEKQSTHSSKKFKWKGKTESLVEQEAKELRALKAYNEMTLLEDKKELEARKKLLSARTSIDDVTEGLKNRTQSRKTKLKQDNPRSVEQVDDVYLGKENFFADATTETESMSALQSRENKVFVAGEKFANISNEVYPCSKLSKVNKVTDKLLENFDRLHGGQTKIEMRKSKQSVETDTRKLYTKYSKPKKLIREENVSVVSVKKLEGLQRGRELERIQAKEGVRNRLTVSSEDGLSVVEDRLVYEHPECAVEPLADELDRSNEIVTTVDGGEDRTKDYGSFTTIKSAEMKNVASIWSSSTIDQEDESKLLVQNDTKIAIQRETAAKTRDEIKDEEDKIPKVQSKTPISAAEAVIAQAEETQLQGTQSEIRLLVRDPEEETLEPSRSNEEFVPSRQTTDLTDFARNIEVTCTHNSVILSNPSAPKGEILQRRNIVDDDTIRMLHHAFSDRSIDYILGLSGEILLMNDMLNNGQPILGHDEINFYPNVETMGTIMEELPPLPHEEQNIKRQIICRLQNPEEITHQESDPCCSIILPLNSEIDADIEFEIDEEIELTGMNDLEINDFLLTMIRLLGCFNVPQLNSENVSAENYEILRGMMEYAGEPQQMEEENEEDKGMGEEADKMMERLLRFVVEDICTDIRFPVVVRLSDITVTAFDTTSDVPEEMDEDLVHVEPSKINLFSFEDNANEVIIESGTSTGKCYEEVEEIDAAKALRRDECPIPNVSFSSGQFVNFGDHGIVEGVLDVRRLAGSMGGTSDDNNYFLKTVNTLKGCTMISSGVGRSFGSEENQMDEIRGRGAKMEENIRQEGGEDNIIYRVIEEGVKIIDEGQGKFGDEETEEIQFPVNDETDENEENDSLERLEEIRRNLPLDLNAEERDQNIEINKDVTFQIILTFWLVVIYFYIRHFCRKILALGQISRSTSTLKPFEIHTVPTSTTTLLENTKLIHELQRVSVPEVEEYWVEYENEEELEDEEDDEEYSYLLPEIIDHEIEDSSWSNEYHSLPNFDSTAFQTLSDYSGTESERSTTKVENEVERTMIYLMERVTENVKILPFFASDEDIINNHKEEEEETPNLKSSEMEANCQLELNSQSTSPITSDDQLNSVRRLSDSNTPSSNSRPEIGKRLKLHLTRKDLEDFRSKGDDGSSTLTFSATCDDEATSSNQVRSSFLYAEIEIQEIIDAPDTEEVSNPDGNEESISSIVIPHGERCRLPNTEEEMYENNDTDNNNEEIEKSVEQNASTSSPECLNTTMQSTDSFDSTYTKASETSQNSTSVPDLNESSMEEFPITTSLSNESN